MPKIDGILETMRAGGLRITPQRRLIISYILKTKGAVSAQQLWEDVRIQQPDVSMDTIYRNLSSLCELGVLCRVDKLGKGSEYEFVAGRHVHYMTCTDCGRREVFDGCAVDAEALGREKLKGFRLTGHKLDLYGLCEKCDKKGLAEK